MTVPVQIGSTLGQVVADADGYLRARLPAASVTRVDHAPLVSSQVTAVPTTSSEWSSAFSAILGEVDDLHLLEGASSRTYYYGFIPKRTSGLAGMGYRPGNAAVGFDLPNSPNAVRETMVHEVGHNLSLRHAPCGDPSSPDTAYPYANAALGAGNRFIWGYDAGEQPLHRSHADQRARRDELLRRQLVLRLQLPQDAGVPDAGGPHADGRGRPRAGFVGRSGAGPAAGERRNPQRRGCASIR